MVLFAEILHTPVRLYIRCSNIMIIFLLFAVIVVMISHALQEILKLIEPQEHQEDRFK